MSDSERERQLNQVLRSRSKEDRDIEQFLMPPQDVIKTARLIGKYTRGSIGLIGDNDHVSVALKTLYPERRVNVLEHDTRIIKSIGELSAKMCVEPADIFDYDVRNPIPEELRGSVDHTYTNPPHLKASGTGYKACINRGWELSGPKAWSLMSMPCGTAAMAPWAKRVQEATFTAMKQACFEPILFDTANTAHYPTANDAGLTSCLLGYRTPNLEAPHGVIFDSVYH